ncbi:MAG: hypothetical protein J6R74_07290 [Tidjanibacter sp.]|nr:hypothetical protein [Tidjanibacter sp.]
MAITQTTLEKNLEVMLLSRCRGMSSCRTIEYLISNGLISPTAAKAFVIRQRVEELCTKQRMSKTEAMRVVADATSCSYGTVAGYIYKRTSD